MIRSVVILLVLCCALWPALAFPAANLELEDVVQSLRAYDDKFVAHPVITLDLDDAIATFHELWLIGRHGARLAGRNKALATDFHILENRAHTAARAGMQARPSFRRSKPLPPEPIDHLTLAPADPILIKPVVLRTGQLVATVVARGEEAQDAIRRILMRFPLWGDDSTWIYRPPPRAWSR